MSKRPANAVRESSSTSSVQTVINPPDAEVPSCSVPPRLGAKEGVAMKSAGYSITSSIAWAGTLTPAKLR
jgi:hypothetical protein